MNNTHLLPLSFSLQPSAFPLIAAFIRRDFLTERSYRLSFALGALATLANLAVFYFIGKLFGGSLAAELEPYGSGYFAYVFTAQAFFGYIGTGAGSYAGRLRLEQTQGTLEAALSTPLGILPFLAALSAWNFIFATFELLVYALAGIFIFKLDFSAANWPAASLVFLLSAACFAALGILSSCFVVLFKRGNPLAWVLNNFEGLLGGVYFPVAVLPGWLLAVSNLLPVTYAVRAFQLAVHRGAGLSQLKDDLLILLIFDLVLLPASAWLFSLSVKRARRTGTLGEY
ncbi:MAG: ABC transporter permease [Elusimicrobia bacterium]|nr:ABC transporter permease [Elusimicrobiota bacterium]